MSETAPTIITSETDDPQDGEVSVWVPSGPFALDDEIAVHATYKVGSKLDAVFPVTLAVTLERGNQKARTEVRLNWGNFNPTPKAGDVLRFGSEDGIILYPTTDLAGVSTLSAAVTSAPRRRDNGQFRYWGSAEARVDIAHASATERHAYIDPEAVHYEVHDFAKGKIIFHFADGTLSHEMTREQQLRGTLDHPKTLNDDRLNEHISLGAQD